LGGVHEQNNDDPCQATLLIYSLGSPLAGLASASASASGAWGQKRGTFDRSIEQEQQS